MNFIRKNFQLESYRHIVHKMFTQPSLAVAAVVIETSSTFNIFTLRVRNIPDCWHGSNFTVPTLHNTPINVTNPTCHDDLHESHFALDNLCFALLHVTCLFICDATTRHGRTNPRKPWNAWPSWAGVTWYLYFYLWVFSENLATCFCCSVCVFQVAPKFFEHVYIGTACNI